jgi:predicted MFS family arabinose efflux permease
MRMNCRIFAVVAISLAALLIGVCFGIGLVTICQNIFGWRMPADVMTFCSLPIVVLSLIGLIPALEWIEERVETDERRARRLNKHLDGSI